MDFKNYDILYLRILIKAKFPLYLKSDNVFAPASSTTHLSPALASGNKLSETMTSPLKEEKTLITSNVKSIVYKKINKKKKKKETRMRIIDERNENIEKILKEMSYQIMNSLEMKMKNVIKKLPIENTVLCKCKNNNNASNNNNVNNKDYSHNCK